MSKLICDSLYDYNEKSFIRFHMPGHKGRVQKNSPQMSDFYPFDTTELPETDDLFNPKSFIKDAEERCAKAFGSEKSFFLVNGSSSGVITMIVACFCPGDQVIVGRNCHQSVIFGLIMCGAKPIYIMPETTPAGICGGINPQKVEDEFVKNPRIKGVILTSPTYQGAVMEVDKISQITKKYGGLLLVDEAHGAHFPFSNLLPEGAMAMGADAAVTSLHKNLPCPNQTAVINCKAYLYDKIHMSLGLTQTTSPSFPLLSLADSGIDEFIKEGKKYYKKLYDELGVIYNQRFSNIALLNNSLKEYYVKAMDFTKLCVVFEKSGLLPVNAEEIIRKKFDICCEMADENSLLFMVSPYNSHDEISLLNDALQYLDRYTFKEEENVASKYSCPKTLMLPRDAFFATKKTIPLKDAVGRVSASHFVVCPPCIPIITYGELIDEDICKKIAEKFGEKTIDVVV